jgi:hypothetical protein
MTPDERVAALKELLPGLKDVVYEALIAEHPLGTLECSYQLDLVEPLRDLMVRLRFNDAKKLRVANYCGARGAVFLGNVYHSFKQVMYKKERADLTVALEVLAGVDQGDEEEMKAAAEVINELNDKDDNGPVLAFNLQRALLAIQAEKLLKRTGNINQRTPINTAINQVWSLVKRAERRPERTMEELLGIAPPRSSQPNMLFSDGRFGDGTRLETVTLADGTTEQRRTSLVEPLVPEFIGMNRVQIEKAIRAKIEESKKKG